MKDFIIIGNQNIICCKEIFPLIKENKMWMGYTEPKDFLIPDTEITDEKKQYQIGTKIYQRFGNICWFTNFEIDKRREKLPLSRKYEGNEEHYPKYDNYDVIEVSKTKNIPYDYDGVMGVPISFLPKYCPEQFEIVWQASGNTRASAPTNILTEVSYCVHKEDRGGCAILNGKRVFSRILIRRK